MTATPLTAVAAAPHDPEGITQGFEAIQGNRVLIFERFESLGDWCPALGPDAGWELRGGSLQSSRGIVDETILAE
jgi:hypothetical protein